MLDQVSQQDFQRAMTRATWRRILTWLTGADNQLLPYDEFRARLPVRGQHYIGMRQVPIEKIVGSMGRYNDFDRAFLPIQKRTKERWISIDQAHLADVHLPPVELIKIGEIYFVKDGNHRVSVARERGQLEIDAYITEIDTPIKLSPDIKIDDLERQKKQIDFLLETNLNNLRPDAEVTLSDPELYSYVLEHINTHRWYLGLEHDHPIEYERAVASWYDHVYLPLVEEIRRQDLPRAFPGSTEADLYLWVVEYEKYLRLAYSNELNDEQTPPVIAAQQLAGQFPQSEINRLIQLVSRTNWLESIILDQERGYFFEQTRIHEVRPEAQIEVSLPGKYDRLRDHIAVHRWYLGEQQKRAIPYPEAVASWYDHVYLPIVQVIREQGVLKEFPGRTETDLYLWIVRHQWVLRETYGEDIPIEKAAEQVAEQRGEAASESSLQKVVKVIKKAGKRKAS